MRIGILTFHSQLNYGGVLQCWALCRYLRSQGYDVKVIDRWLDGRNKTLKGSLCCYSPIVWGGIIIRTLAGCGNWKSIVRRLRTIAFIKSIGLTDYNFYQWNEVPKDLGVDCIVVGSDQVWHAGDECDPRPYLLEGAPSVLSVAYAASFGMTELPEEYRRNYKEGFARFKAISVREACGIELIKGTGCKLPIRHVVDPTLLLERESWKELGGEQKIAKRLICYFISESIVQAYPVLLEWAEKYDWTVEVVCVCYNKPFPRTVKELISRMLNAAKAKDAKSRVCIRTEYGPREFVAGFSRAEACITDSFHAVMFSMIFGLNVRFLKPRDMFRSKMFARISELNGNAICGSFLSDNLKEALESLTKGENSVYKTEIISERIRESREWLKQALSKVDDELKNNK